MKVGLKYNQDEVWDQIESAFDAAGDSTEIIANKPRRINKMPFKGLDAPQLQDDFYLNLVDWSNQNVLAVGLNRAVYVWSACNS